MLKPVQDYVLVEIIRDDLGGISLPGDSDKESQRGKVVKVGQGTMQYVRKIDDDMSIAMRTEMFVKEGETIIWQKYADADYSFEEDGKEYTLIDIKQIMAVEE